MNRFKLYGITFCRITKCHANCFYFLIISPISISWNTGNIAVLSLSLEWVLITQACPTLCDPLDCNPPGSSVHGILQARILKWVAFPFSRGSSQPRYWIWVSCVTGRFFITEPPGNLVPSLEICNLAFCKVYFSFVGWSFHLLCDFFKLKHIYHQKKGMIPEQTEFQLTSSSFLIFEIEQNSMFKPHQMVHLFWDEKNEISYILD